jgi:hypothetical protein
VFDSTPEDSVFSVTLDSFVILFGIGPTKCTRQVVKEFLVFPPEMLPALKDFIRAQGGELDTSRRAAHQLVNITLDWWEGAECAEFLARKDVQYVRAQARVGSAYLLRAGYSHVFRTMPNVPHLALGWNTR